METHCLSILSIYVLPLEKTNLSTGEPARVPPPSDKKHLEVQLGMCVKYIHNYVAPSQHLLPICILVDAACMHTSRL